MKPCIMCWGGGLRKFEESILEELKKESLRLINEN